MVEIIGTVSRREKDRAFLSLLVTRGGRATRSDTQTTMLIQVHFRRVGEGIWLTESGALWLSTSTNFTDVLGTSFAVWLTKSDADGSVRALRMCGCADGSRRAVRNGSRRACGIGSVADDERFREGNYQRLNPRMRQAISSGLRASMSKAVRWLSSAVVARRFRTSARSTNISFFV